MLKKYTLFSDLSRIGPGVKEGAIARLELLWDELGLADASPSALTCWSSTKDWDLRIDDELPGFGTHCVNLSRKYGKFKTRPPGHCGAWAAALARPGFEIGA
mgnify:CR=1 FL=1